MRRTSILRMVVCVTAAAIWAGSEKDAAAHCLGGAGIHACCAQLADCDASTVRYGPAPRRYSAKGKYYGKYRYGYTTSQPVIHRGQLSQRNRNGGIN